MIVVIADDLTGAAELGGLGLRYGLATEVTTRVSPASRADLLIIATDTRSLPREAAEAAIRQVCKEVEALKPRLVFKKIDSVLRGHVLPEIGIQLQQLRLRRALIVPANPGLGRTVEDGTYLLHGRPLHLSSFSEDPEFPVRSSRVQHMLYARDGEVSVLKTQDAMPATGIVVGEVKDAADLAAWCGKIDADTLVAGAAEFFNALLESLHLQPAAPERRNGVMRQPALMVCGSAFHQHRAAIREAFPVSYMPAALVGKTTGEDALFRGWMEEAQHHLRQTGKAGIAAPQGGDRRHALSIRTLMAEAAAYIISHTRINELLIEGGATAAAVIRRLHIETLYPVAALAPGVTSMNVKGKEDLHLTLKVGSYEWPPSYLLPQQVEGN